MGAWERDFGRQLHLLLDPRRPGQRTRASCKPNGSTLSNLEKTLKTKITTFGNSATPQAPLTERNGAHTARPHVVQKLRIIAFFCLADFIQRHLQRLSWKAIFQLTEFEPSIPQQGVMFGLEEDEEGE